MGNADEIEFSMQNEWFRFGVFLAILYATFTLALFYLLRVDQTLALIVAVVMSIVFAVAITVYVLYFKRPEVDR